MLLLPFEVLHASAELIGRLVRKTDEGVGFLEALVYVRAVFSVTDINVGEQAFGYEL